MPARIGARRRCEPRSQASRPRGRPRSQRCAQLATILPLRSTPCAAGLQRPRSSAKPRLRGTMTGRSMVWISGAIFCQSCKVCRCASSPRRWARASRMDRRCGAGSWFRIGGIGRVSWGFKESEDDKEGRLDLDPIEIVRAQFFGMISQITQHVSACFHAAGTVGHQFGKQWLFPLRANYADLLVDAAKAFLDGR